MAWMFRVGSAVGMEEAGGNLVLCTSHTSSVTFMIERADVVDFFRVMLEALRRTDPSIDAALYRQIVDAIDPPRGADGR